MQKNLAHILTEISGESKLDRLRVVGYDPLDEDQDRAHGLMNSILQQKYHSLTTLKLPFIIPSREDLHKLLLFPTLTNVSIGINESLVVSHSHYHYHYHYHSHAAARCRLGSPTLGTPPSTRTFGARTSPTFATPPPTAPVSICGRKPASHAGNK